ncbi:pullulanase-associated domain-containing protein [Paracerasibacillus soli]|uniref:Pullulanase-associated domain-containing protein n=1 Tax=Paracerasibacillus soli TaxID=480284 RepID=A0ABU5CS65_9BACI|nr:pullulanase-associated domain-containing protein [Virgibacillus soli]MDY0409222.1 pullulanase-associated domain-containing protein [Virgibacillus soli]
MRVHYKRADNQFTDLGLWLWEDVAAPSENWPAGSTAFKDTQRTEYGAYVDIPLAKDAQKVGFLVVHTKTGEKDGNDKFVELFSKDINETWIEEGSDDVAIVEPIVLPESTIRIHYKKADKTYGPIGIWTWDDVLNPSNEWPNDAMNYTEIGPYGAYYDVTLADNPEKLSFLFVNKENEKQTVDYTYSNFKYNQLFITDGDENIYTNPYGSIATMLLSGEILSDKKIQLKFSKTDELTAELLKENINLVDKNGQKIDIDIISIIDNTMVELYGDFDLNASPFTVSYGEQTFIIQGGWRMIDEMYAYDGELGAKLHKDGTATLKLWSPKADQVSVVLYDTNNQDKVILENLPMTKNEQGVWEVKLNNKNTGLDSLRGYYYHYKVTHGDETKLALDPYAKSMAGWANEESGGKYAIGKASIVEPSTIGPKLNYAEIDGFEKREDAIIYEVHVRDFTSDPSIADDLTAQFGTFASFIEKLDYIEDLGVTHIQLLPVMSYYFGNEWKSDERLLDWSSSGNNYNWGYDPHSYFSLTGMYSKNQITRNKGLKSLND